MPIHYLRAVPFITVLAIILFTGLNPEPVPQVFDQQDKIHHLLGFAALMFTLRLAFPNGQFAWQLAASLVAALLIEIAQGFLPNRTASMGDMLANTLGVFAGWVSWQVADRGWRRIGGKRDTSSQAGADGLESVG